MNFIEELILFYFHVSKALGGVLSPQKGSGGDMPQFSPFVRYCVQCMYIVQCNDQIIILRHAVHAYVLGM